MVRVKLFIGAVALSLGVLAAACGGGGGEPAATEPPMATEPAGGGGGVELGRSVFQGQAGGATPCTSCHEVGSEIAGATVGPELAGLAGRAGERKPGLSAEQYIRESIEDPGAYLVEGYRDLMLPNIADQLSPEEMDGLVQFLLTLQ